MTTYRAILFHMIQYHDTISSFQMIRIGYMDKHILHMPYFALPVNEDFNVEFDKLIGRFKKLLLLI
jgi:hypothetical protein